MDPNFRSIESIVKYQLDSPKTTNKWERTCFGPTGSVALVTTALGTASPEESMEFLSFHRVTSSR